MKERKIIDHFEETHRIRTYSIPEVKDFLEESGFAVLGFYNSDLNQSSKLELAGQSTFRVMAVATPVNP